MMRSRLRVPVVALAVLMVLTAAGARVGPARAQDDITLTVWDQFTGPESDVLDAIYEGFTAANPNVTIEREAYSVEQMQQTVNTALSSGTGPDVIVYDPGPGYAGVLAEAGLLLPLDELAAQYGWRDRIAAASIEGTTLDGQLLGLPLTVDLIGMYYNQTLLTEAGLTVPTTVAELATFCGQAMEAGYIPIAFANNPGWEAFHQFSMTSNQMLGAEAMRRLLIDKTGTWNSPEVITAIQTFFVDLREAGCFSDDVNALAYEDGNDLFYTGQALLHTTGSWLVNDIQTNMADYEVGLVPFPEIAGGQGREFVSGVGSAYFISAGTEYPTEAGLFLDYLFSPETALRWVNEASFFIPQTVDVAAIEAPPLRTSVLETLQTAVSEGSAFGYNVDVLAPPDFITTMQNGFQAILAGDKTPEELAAELQDAWEASYPGTPGA